jgi:HSP20 family molecular chaperone IbpA
MIFIFIGIAGLLIGLAIFFMGGMAVLLTLFGLFSGVSDKVYELKTIETPEKIVYEITLKDKSEVEVSISEGKVTISQKITEEKASFSTSSSFRESFPVPDNTDVSRSRIDHEGNKITVSFPKFPQN